MTRLFIKVPINNVFRNIQEDVVKSLNSYGSFQGSDPETIANQKVQNYKIKPIELQKENTKITPMLTDIAGGRGQTARILYTIGYSGDRELFDVQPNEFGDRTINANIADNVLQFYVDPKYATLEIPEPKIEEARREALRIINFIANTLEQINKESEEFNSTLFDFTVQEVQKRMDDENKMNKLKDNLNPFSS